MSTRNREITFIVKMRNQARQAIQGLSGDLRKVAREAGRSAATMKETVKGIDGIQVSATQAAAAVSKLNKNVGGAVDPLNRKQKAVKGLWQELKTAAVHALKFAAIAAMLAAPIVIGGALLEQSANWRGLEARIALVADTQEQANAAMSRVYDIAQRTRTPLEGVGTLFYRTAAAVKEYGYSLNDAAKITELASQAMIVSGASAQEAQGALIQFSQGLASNKLGGEELRSVLEQAPRLARAIIDGMNATSPELAKKYGMTIEKTMGQSVERVRELTLGAFKKMAEDGVTTTDVIMKALLSQTDKMAIEFGKYPLLARDAANVAKNALMKEFAEIDAIFGVNSNIAKGLIALGTTVVPLISEVIKPIADLIGGLAALVLAPFELLGKLMASMGVTAGQAQAGLALFVRGLSAALATSGALWAVLKGGPLLFGLISKGAAAAALGVKGLTAAMLTNPFTAIAVAITALVALFLTFQDSMVKVGDKSYSVGSLIIETFRSVVSFLGAIFKDIWGVIEPVLTGIDNGFRNVISLVVRIFAAGFKEIGKHIGTLKEYYDAYVKTFFDGLAKIPAWYANIIRNAWSNLANYLRAGMTMLGQFVSTFNADWGAKISAAGQTGANVLEGMGNAYAATVEGIPAMVVAGVRTAVGAIDPLIDHVGRRWSGAFADQGERMENRDRIRGIKNKTIDEAVLNNGNGNRVLPEPKEDKDAKKRADAAAREREKRVKELASSIKSLTSAYTPWLESSLKDVEAQEQLAALNKARAQSAGEFKDALDRVNMSMAQYKQLAYAVTNNLKADAVKAFFAEYADGWEQITKDQERLKTGEVVSALIAAQSKAINGGEKERTEYAEYLKGLGITADQAASAIARFNGALSKSEFSAATEEVKAFIEANAPYAKMLNDREKAVSDLAGLEQLRTANGEDFEKILQGLGYSEETYAEAVRRARLEQAAHTDGMSAAKIATEDYIAGLQTEGMRLRDVFSNAFQSMEDGIVSFITTGKLDFKGMVDSMIADLARLAAQKMMMKFATSVLGGFPVGHSGGIVSGRGPISRMADPSVFAGAKRFHVGGIVGSGGGLRANEVPVIAKKDEAILPTARMSDGNLGVKAILPDGWDGRKNGGQPSGPSTKTIHLSPTIHLTVEGGSKEEAEETGQIVSAAMLAALKGMVRDVLVDESRPGGILNQ